MVYCNHLSISKSSEVKGTPHGSPESLFFGGWVRKSQHAFEMRMERTHLIDLNRSIVQV